MGANPGKVALQNCLPELASDGKVSPDTLTTIFNGYTGSKDGKGVMSAHQLQRLFRDIVNIQKRGGEIIYKQGLAIFQNSPEYKNMGWIERSALNITISATKTAIFTAFSVAMTFYTNIENMKSIHRQFDPSGNLTQETFLSKAPGIIAAELGKRNLVVAADLFNKYGKS
mmetsp:Transcript_8957/g.13396  ORF Transcript_8957/g.13396 Transcript_8957/m.13396 type:complete len:170 (-) Transcript_8957:29-538(-)